MLGCGTCGDAPSPLICDMANTVGDTRAEPDLRPYYKTLHNTYRSSKLEGEKIVKNDAAGARRPYPPASIPPVWGS